MIPCPSGPATPDSFRLWEALEAGCVPIADGYAPAAAAAIDLFLGFSLMSLDPGPRAAAVGTFVGISLVFWGASLAAFGGSVRSLGRELENE